MFHQSNHSQLVQKILSINNEKKFEQIAIEVFRYQVENVDIYRQYVANLNIKPEQVKKLTDIPFLPIELFKTHKIYPENISEPEIIFTSSGTTGINTSRHYVKDKKLYEASFQKTFKLFYGQPSEYIFLALLPSYLERQGSSLVYMVEKLNALSKSTEGGFYLYNFDELAAQIDKIKGSNKKTFIFAVTFSLLDFSEQFPIDLSDAIVMETGGMKGRKKELIRDELHQILKERNNIENVHSEYGMTELLSQAYSSGKGIFRCPPWMKIMIRDTYDAFSFQNFGKTGGINVIDLANIYSCSFIETKDLGRINTEGCFEILGRYDQSDVRGCNLLVT